MSVKEQDWVRSCPICFADDIALAKVSNCGHEFCIPCLQQLFFRSEKQIENEMEILVDGSHNNASNGTSDTYVASTTKQLLKDLIHFNVANIETIVRCPCCRSPISMLAVFQDQLETPIWSRYCITRFEETPLCGKVFATAKGIGHKSFHFQSKASCNEDLGKEKMMPYILWNSSSGANSNNVAPSTTGLSKEYFFDSGCFYFAPKRTFHGTISLPDSYDQIQQCSAILSFALDHSSVTGGIIIRQPSINNVHSAPKNDGSNFPLDGLWKVMWYSDRIPPNVNIETCGHLLINTDVLHVSNNLIQLQNHDLDYLIRYEINRIYFDWPDLGVVQTLEAECDFRGGSGVTPPVEAILRWTTTELDCPYIVWKRLTVEESVSRRLPSIEYFGRSGGDRSQLHRNVVRHSSLSWYREVHISSQNEVNHYVANALWGNAFCQADHVGLASYHFCQAENPIREQQPKYAYISYESEACEQWPPLDDGSPIPPRVPFHNISVEKVAKDVPIVILGQAGNEGTSEVTHVVFRGTIEWLKDYGTTWQGSQRWEYEMVFDTQFTCILSGSVHSTTASDTREDMSHYGSTLIYVNAAISRAYEMHLHTVISSGDETSAIVNDELLTADHNQRYIDLTSSMRGRLSLEGATSRTVAALCMALSRAHRTNSESRSL
jgi:Zinc finger, C3HC4 type (RING finger)